MAGRVAILLGLYDGADHLGAQLDSFLAQTHDDWHLTVSDDGSTDDGPAILERFAARAGGRVAALRAGPGQGPAMNFLSMLAGLEDGHDYVALSDQDDVWLPDRLARGIAALEGITGPALYGSATWIVDAALQGRTASPRFTRPPGFGNALVQSIAGGNTMLMNRAGAALARAAAPEAMAVGGPLTQDWWLYQLFTGAGATVIRDETPTLLYRQHGRNLYGTNRGAAAALRRVRGVLGGEMGAWVAQNGRALGASAHRLTPGNRATLAAFLALRRQGIAARARGFPRLGLYRQRGADMVLLHLAAILGRL